jgi:hypothetical protein
VARAHTAQGRHCTGKTTSSLRARKKTWISRKRCATTKLVLETCDTLALRGQQCIASNQDRNRVCCKRQSCMKNKRDWAEQITETKKQIKTDIKLHCFFLPFLVKLVSTLLLLLLLLLLFMCRQKSLQCSLKRTAAQN